MAERQPGFRTAEEWDRLLAYVDELVSGIEAVPDETLKDHVFELLQAVDAVHREGLTRLVRLFKEGVLEQVVTDPAIRTLMEMYDLLPQQSECGKVYDFITGHPEPGGGALAQAKVARPAIRERVPIPHWVPAAPETADLGMGEVTLQRIEDADILLCRVGDSAYALRGRCLCGEGLMAGAVLQGYTLRCPGRGGCLFDVRSGARIGQAGGIEGFATRMDPTGRVAVGFDMPFEPSLPVF